MKLIQLLKEIKINKPNLYFRQNGDIIDTDEEMVWVDFSPKWNPNLKIYSDYSIDGNIVTMGIWIDGGEAGAEDAKEEAKIFQQNLEKYNIEYEIDISKEIINFFIPKKYFEFPK